MGQVLHGSATTTHAVRAAIQRSKASIQELSERYSINPKTVVKWRKRGFVEDAPMGPKERRSTVLSAGEEALARLPQAYAAAARRLPLRAPGDNPPSDPLQSVLVSPRADQEDAPSQIERRQGVAVLLELRGVHAEEGPMIGSPEILSRV